MIHAPAVKTRMHYTHNNLINPTNPLTVFLIGAGGTGSQMVMSLARINHALRALDHPGLRVYVWDNDMVTEANLGRQLFAEAELGLNKATCLVARVNRFFGTNWKAVPYRFDQATLAFLEQQGQWDMSADLYISCVDSVGARHEIADVLQGIVELVHMPSMRNNRTRPTYWMDFGNSRDSGQVILSTLGPEHSLRQSAKYEVVTRLPLITEEFADLLAEADTGDDTPSCSLAEALEKQDLFVNSNLAQWGSTLLWQMFRNGMTPHRGVFMNLRTMRTTPLPV